MTVHDVWYLYYAYIHVPLSHIQESSPSRLSAPSPASSQGIQQLKQQLATLTSSMATLMEEKSKMESNFQADKKAILVCSNSVALGG